MIYKDFRESQTAHTLNWQQMLWCFCLQRCKNLVLVILSHVFCFRKSINTDFLTNLCLRLSVSVTEVTVIILKAGNTAMHKKRTYPCKPRYTTTFPVAVLFDLITYNCCKLDMGISCLPFLRKTDYLTATCVFFF